MNPFNTTQRPRPGKALSPSLSLSDLIASPTAGIHQLHVPCRQCPLAPLHPRSRGVGSIGLGLIGKQKNQNRLSWKPKSTRSLPKKRKNRFPILLKHRDFRGLHSQQNYVRLRAAAPIPRAQPTTPPNTDDDDELIDFFFSRAAVILPHCTRRPDRGCNITIGSGFRISLPSRARNGNKVLMPVPLGVNGVGRCVPQLLGCP